MKDIKKAMALSMAVLMVVSFIPGQTHAWAEPDPEAPADDADNIITFTVTDEEGGAVILSSPTLTISQDEGGTETVTGSINTSENEIVFTPDAELEEGTYYYTLKTSGYKDALGTFDGADAEVQITVTEKSGYELLNAEQLEMTYGDDAVSLGDYVSVPDDYDGAVTYSVTSGDAIISVSSDEVTALQSGSAVIHVAAAETENYKAEEEDISVSVAKKDLGALTASDVVFNDIENVYNGESLWNVSGTVNTALLEEGDTLDITGIATSGSAAVGTYSAAVTGIATVENSKYTASFAKKGFTAGVTITAYPVDVKVANIDAVYGSSDWLLLKSGRYTDFVTEKRAQNLISAETDIPEALQKEMTASLQEAAVVTFDAKALEDAHYGVGTYNSLLNVTFDAGKSGNFAFSTDDTPALNVIIETTASDEALWEDVEIDTQSEDGVYINGNTIFLAENGYVTFRVGDSASDKYDTVAISLGGEYSNKVSGTGTSGSLSGTFYLYDSKNPATRTDAKKKSGVQDNIIPADALVVDADAPSAKINGKKATALTDETADDIEFETVTEIPSITGEFTDAGSGVKEVTYAVIAYNAEDKDNVLALTERVEKLADKEWKNWEEMDDSDMKEDGNYLMIVKTQDEVGNTVYSAYGYAKDTEAPQIDITGLTNGKLYDTDVSFGYTVTEPSSGDAYSGLKSVACEILNNGEVTQSSGYSFDDPAARKKTAEYSETVSAEKNNSNRVTIRVTATDYAGNTYTEEKTIGIDITSPRIEITYDKTTANGYYNASRTATVRVYERNFNAEDFALSFQSQLGNGAQIGTWSMASDMGESDEAVSVFTIVFSKDDTYTLTASVKDLAGNGSSLDRTDTFTIDKTLPVVQVAFDNNSASNGNYYNSARTATITVTDRNFDKAAFSLNLQAQMSGNGSAPAIAGWTDRGDTHTATLVFQHDGTYSFNCGASDLAGNTSSTVQASTFIIDRTAPVITFSGVADKTSYNSNLSPAVTYTDLNMDKNGKVIITLSGERHQKKVLTGTYEAMTNGGRVTLEDFAKTRSEDDVYTLTATYTDLAGNRTENSIVFSVNRFGSNYTFDDSTKELLEKYYLQEGRELVIYETNVDPLASEEVTVGFNGTTKTLKEGTDYTVNKSADEGWNVYAYTIKASCFAEEGMYEVVITSTDTAGNKQDNKLKDTPVGFVVDRTAPSAIITGVDDNARYNAKTKDVTVNLTDDYAVAKAEIYIDGKLVETLDADQIEKLDGVYTLTVGESDAYQEISIKIYDAAGNEADSDSIHILVTSNALTQYFYNKPLFYGSLSALAVILLAIILVVSRRHHGRR